MSQALRKIAGNASKCNCTVLFLNQLRHKVAHPQHRKRPVHTLLAFLCIWHTVTCARQ